MSGDLPIVPNSREGPVRILFVCLGNICRSPLAEGVFQHLVRSEGLEGRFHAESAGTGAWHVGETPDPRSREVAVSHGIQLGGRARRVETRDMDQFHLLVAMDRDNLARLEDLRDGHGRDVPIRLLRDFDPEAGAGDREVPDPYYGGPDGFETVFRMVERSCRGLLERLREEG